MQNPGNIAFIVIKKIKNDEETLIPLIKFSNTYPSNENLSDLILSYTLLLFVYFFRNILNINSGIQKTDSYYKYWDKKFIILFKSHHS